MSRYPTFQGTLSSYALRERPSKISTSRFARAPDKDSLSGFLASLPDVLAARDLRLLVDRIRLARENSKPIIWGFGGHVIKVGLACVLVDLMDRGYVTALATNGSGIIHDFEIALSGKTSEDVDQTLAAGSFGMARETGKLINQAISQGAQDDCGIGESMGKMLSEIDTEYPEHSLVLQAYLRQIPLTAHIAMGTDIIHMHPQASGEAIGRGSLIDFRVFTHQVSLLGGGGVYLNVGSAVILPEVFLKAVSLVRNAGVALEGMVTANLDFIQHYRPLQNVVRRPVDKSGLGVAITGHHEIMIPLLAALLIHSGSDQGAETAGATGRR